MAGDGIKTMGAQISNRDDRLLEQAPLDCRKLLIPGWNKQKA
jgi:hypothetical protein